MCFLALTCCLAIAFPAPPQSAPVSITIYGTVRLPDGSPAQRAVVQLNCQLNPTLQAFTDDLGRYEIPNIPRGHFWITALNRSDPDQFSEQVEFETSRGTPSRLLINLYLRTGVKIKPGGLERSAVITTTAAAQRVPKPAQKAFDQAQKYRSKNQHEKALANYTRSIYIFPTYLRAYAERGYLRIAAVRIEEAAQDFSRALELDSRYEPALRGLGICEFQQENYESALGFFERAIAVSPRSASNHLFAGICQSQLGRHDVAREELERALAIDPKGTVRAHVHLANLWIKENQPRQAIAELESYLAAVPNAQDADMQRTILERLRSRVKRE
jgi:tetratricopeptide (TPR) repeat protein